MKKRLMKKIFCARRGRPDSPKLAFERGNWPWNAETWERAARAWWNYLVRQQRRYGEVRPLKKRRVVP